MKTWINITGTHTKKKFSKRKLTKLIWLMVSKRNHVVNPVVYIIIIGMANGMAKRKFTKLIYPTVSKRKNDVSTVVTRAATDSVLLKKSCAASGFGYKFSRKGASGLM